MQTSRRSQFRKKKKKRRFIESTALVCGLRWTAGIGCYSPWIKHVVKKRKNDMPEIEEDE
jgi:hypothetical protein